MPNQHKNPVLGWRPPPALVSRLRALVEERGGGRGVQSDILTQALREYLEHNENSSEGERHDVGHISDR